MVDSSQRNRSYRLYVSACLAGGMLFFSGCASAPAAPTASLTEAKRSIEVAEREDASHYAGAELDEARQKLVLADKSVAAEDMILAQRLAEQATVTAKLATARTEAAKAEAVNEEMRRGAEALTEEMQRAGDQQ